MTLLHLFLFFMSIFLPSCFGSEQGPVARNAAKLQTCGQLTDSANKVSRIIGGTVANTFPPWYVALVKPETRYAPNYSVACGAALITSKHVVTAGHCYLSPIPHKDDLVVVINLTNRCKRDGTILETADLKIHEHYHGMDFIPKNDIALIYLKEEVSNMPVCLPSKGRYAGYTGQIFGFGSTVARSIYPCKMMYSDVNIIPKKDCVKGMTLEMAQKTICAGHLNGRKDACDGDSGGPLIVQNKNNGAYELIGIVSYGDGCGRANNPGIYTDVTKRGFLPWVLKHIGDAKPSGSADNVVSHPTKPEKPTLDNSPSFAGIDYKPPPETRPTGAAMADQMTPHPNMDAQQSRREMQAAFQAACYRQKAAGMDFRM
ncbi:venom protease-like isoform X1 [Nilaparvata lugens]|uniref:venom protease-like isoform X1 n=1 Tax=Nilaparvata lugens TaxID=108931 RepID=UPI00193DDD71|nr:venom protease-like isoform X1 [Nilaparvata lugens]